MEPARVITGDATAISIMDYIYRYVPLQRVQMNGFSSSLYSNTIKDQKAWV